MQAARLAFQIRHMHAWGVRAEKTYRQVQKDPGHCVSHLPGVCTGVMRGQGKARLCQTLNTRRSQNVYGRDL